MSVRVAVWQQSEQVLETGFTQGSQCLHAVCIFNMRYVCYVAFSFKYIFLHNFVVICLVYLVFPTVIKKKSGEINQKEIMP